MTDSRHGADDEKIVGIDQTNGLVDGLEGDGRPEPDPEATSATDAEVHPLGAALLARDILDGGVGPDGEERR
jgi:hypothetical protein